MEIDWGPLDENDATKGAVVMLVVLDLCIVPFAALYITHLLFLSVHKRGRMHIIGGSKNKG